VAQSSEMQGEAPRRENQRERTITRCNFRASGLLSNESTRQLRSMHESFARALSDSLDLFLGSPVDVKLARIDQIGAREFAATLAAGSHLVPFSLLPIQEKVVAKFDNGALFPLLDLLLGGPGESLDRVRELTEIDEELFGSVTELVAAQLERIWKVSNITVTPLASIRSASMGQLFAMDERVVMMQFELRLTTVTSGFSLALPASFSSGLVRNSQGDVGRRSELQAGARQRLRDRVLQCEMPLSVELPKLDIPLGDVVSLEVGSVLNLRTPTQTPVLLQVNGHPIFEVTPVRRAEYKAAQLNGALMNEV
jgi:flagellar motor switch protein FliM